MREEIAKLYYVRDFTDGDALRPKVAVFVDNHPLRTKVIPCADGTLFVRFANHELHVVRVETTTPTIDRLLALRTRDLKLGYKIDLAVKIAGS